jgi:hypothetical protein
MLTWQIQKIYEQEGVFAYFAHFADYPVWSGFGLSTEVQIDSGSVVAFTKEAFGGVGSGHFEEVEPLCEFGPSSVD